MSDALMIGLSSVLASVIATLATFFVSVYINRRKVPLEVSKLNADTNLTKGDLAEKYQGIATRQADENIELSKQNMELKKQMDAYKEEMMTIINANKDDLMEFKKALDIEIERSRKFEDWARRLVMQLQSWNIEPVPFDVTLAKEERRKECIEGYVQNSETSGDPLQLRRKEDK